MLTSEQSIVEYRDGRAIPDRLTQAAHRHYRDHAERMLTVYRDGAGRQRRALHKDIEAIFADEPDCPVQRIQAFCKLLDDAAVYHTDPAGKASKLRLEVFSRASRLHPLVQEPDRLFEYQEAQAKTELARDLGMPWEEIESALYGDVIAFQQLESFPGYSDATAFLSRYNVAQLQATLYRAERMVVTATGDLKIIIRYAKLARLLHEIERLGPSTYRITFSGPLSVLHETRRYGVNFARFLPALLACKGWELAAIVQTPWKTKATLAISDADRFTSRLPAPQEFDSALEESFANKFGPARDGWRLIREGDILHDRQTTFIPDFTFRHDSGAEVYLEIVGFWTPEYLEQKRQTLRRFHGHKILLAVPERSLREGADIPSHVIVYKTSLKIEPILVALEAALGCLDR
jgi:predicted nuclease of restriction endonuclease-like RecB superfamily